MRASSGGSDRNASGWSYFPLWVTVIGLLLLSSLEVTLQAPLLLNTPGSTAAAQQVPTEPARPGGNTSTAGSDTRAAATVPAPIPRPRPLLAGPARTSDGGA